MTILGKFEDSNELYVDTCVRYMTERRNTLQNKARKAAFRANMQDMFCGFSLVTAGAVLSVFSKEHRWIGGTMMVGGTLLMLASAGRQLKQAVAKNKNIHVQDYNAQEIDISIYDLLYQNRLYDAAREKTMFPETAERWKARPPQTMVAFGA